MIHILHEDSENSITTQLLLFLKDYANSFVKNFDVKAFNGIVALRKHVIAFDFNAYSDEQFVLIFDKVRDNQVVKFNTDIIIAKIKDKQYKNVVICDILCIEYILLSYKKLPKLILANSISRNREDIKKLFLLRRELMTYVKNKTDWRLSSLLVSYVNEIRMTKNYNKLISTEKLTYFLLMDLVHKSNFNIGKTRLDDCWLKDCCCKVVNKDNIPDCYLYGRCIYKRDKVNSLLKDTYFSNINEKIKRRFLY